MPTSDIRILCVHGVGRQEIDLSWQEGWKQTVTKGLQPWNPKLQPAFQFVRYEDLFEGAKLDTATIAAAILRLTASGILHGIGDLLPRRRGLAELSERARWTAGMVAQWAADERLRTRACQRIRGEIAAFDPTVVCAHSLGSLIAYDLLARDQGLLRGRTFVSLGSQIGNPFVRSVFGGRLVPLEGGHWYHLYNAGDDVFTAPIRLPPPDFEQVDTPFDLPGIGDHDALAYLGHENTVNRVWRALAPPRAPSRALARTRRALAVTRLRPVRRALLVGINDYPNPEDRLEGCVNDVFEMSAVLQELTFKPADIRVVLNERATAAGIRERLAWLLDGAAAGDIRVFFYSGHGAQIPAYGDAGEVDHLNECLVPYDFDWTPERAFLDDQFLELYSQLPYETNFVAVFDCCHSGGMTRNGLPKARGLNPPDDIRHRSLRWDAERSMWLPRSLRLAKKQLLRSDRDRALYLGEGGATKRLGRGVSLWSDARSFARAKRTYDHHGPYMPVLLQACQEKELSYEYRHGVTSYGAFTYCLTRIFRELKQAGGRLTFEDLIGRVGERLEELRYAQHPALVGPQVKRTASLSYLLGGKRARG
jgi:hypothetical protein